MIKVISDGANKLRDYERVGVSNSSVGFPPEVTFTGESINASEWPSAQNLAEALSAYHETRHEATNAGGAVPDTIRHVVKELPSR